jgi:hypothetical protein
MQLQMIVTELGFRRATLRYQANEDPGSLVEVRLPNHDGLRFGQKVNVLVQGEPPVVSDKVVTLEERPDSIGE